MCVSGEWRQLLLHIINSKISGYITPSGPLNTLQTYCQLYCSETGSHVSAWDYRQTWKCWHRQCVCSKYTYRIYNRVVLYLKALVMCAVVMFRTDCHAVTRLLHQSSRLPDVWKFLTNVYFQNILGSVFQEEESLSTGKIRCMLALGQNILMLISEFTSTYCDQYIHWMDKLAAYVACFCLASNGFYAVINLQLLPQDFCCAYLWNCLCVAEDYVLPKCRSISSCLSLYTHI